MESVSNLTLREVPLEERKSRHRQGDAVDRFAECLDRPSARTLKADNSNLDHMANSIKYSGRTELERRLLANTCEGCGSVEGPMEVHHVRKLKDLKKKSHLGWLDRVMIVRQRKTMILCYNCHHTHHEQQVPIHQLASRIHRKV